jgi:ATP-dependent Lhr-like helicase
VHPSERLTGIDGLRAIVGLLDGFEVAAAAWERSVLPARMDRYDSTLLDTLCLTGEVGWARWSADQGPRPALVGATPIALFLREHGPAWQTMRATAESDGQAPEPALSEAARLVLETLTRSGASFLRDLAVSCQLDDDAMRGAIGELVASGRVASDGFAGLRALVRASSGRAASRASSAGRWSLLRADGQLTRDAALETQARALLGRYGVVCRRLLEREANVSPWRELSRTFRWLEARGEIRGGRFVTGMSGEQFALPQAVERLREVRRRPPDGRLIAISAADPLNLTGIVTSGERVRSVAPFLVVYRDGIPLAARDGRDARPLTSDPDALSTDVLSALGTRGVLHRPTPSAGRA